MADSQRRQRGGARRSGRYLTRLATVPDSGKKNNSGRSTTVKQRPTVFPDFDNDTPRTIIKRLIKTLPEVSPLVPQISKHEETKEAQSELPSKRISNTVEMQLPDFVPEDTYIPTFHMNKKRKKVSISEFERAADRRLPKKKAQSTLDSIILARSLHMSLGSLSPSGSVEKRGLLRRPKHRKAIDMEAFESGVEKNMLKRKAEDYLVDSKTASGIQTAMQTSDAEIVLSNTELFLQPQFDEQSQNKLSPLEPQLSGSKTSAQRSKISDAAQEEAGLVHLVSRVGTNERRYSEGLISNREHFDTRVSPKTPAKQPEGMQDHSQQSNAMEQLPVLEEVVVGEHEIAKGVGAGSLSRHAHAFSSFEKSGMKPLKEDVEQADELDHQPIMVELDGLEEEPTEDEAEDPGSEEVSMKTPEFVRAAACKPLLSTPRPAKLTVCKSPLQPVRAKPVPKSSGVPRRKSSEPEVASSLIKKIFSHYAKMPVSRDAFRIVEKSCSRYFKQLCNDLEAYANHARRKTVEWADLEVLMRRQGLVTDKMPLNVLIERYLPWEYRKLLIPVAVSGNRVIPSRGGPGAGSTGCSQRRALGSSL
ncbi:centromere protein T isoform X2 [Tyto alba]|uniref:centromere protein T isoform X2 n=1 Tax=Tyto alba TaxID=56313 RepID=UPI001C67ABF4|nr:centromere protein T isoform X2 [Tyto alba]